MATDSRGFKRYKKSPEPSCRIAWHKTHHVEFQDSKIQDDGLITIATLLFISAMKCSCESYRTTRISWEEVSENMVRMRIEEAATEASDNATRLKLGVLKALVRTLITELDILENYTVPDKKGMNREGVDFYE